MFRISSIMILKKVSDHKKQGKGCGSHTGTGSFGNKIGIMEYRYWSRYVSVFLGFLLYFIIPNQFQSSSYQKLCVFLNKNIVSRSVADPGCFIRIPNFFIPDPDPGSGG
jgi:hypothetical protein